MPITSGFFNAEFDGSGQPDRKYDADQFSSLFDGLIIDGVFQAIGDALVVKGNNYTDTVTVGTGKCWFNQTWTLNSTVLTLQMPKAHISLPRYDAVVVEINKTKGVRKNSIKVIEGYADSAPWRPDMPNTKDVWYYPLAYIRRSFNNDKVDDMNIYNARGTTECPFVTGLVKTIDADQLFLQWEAQFQYWLSNLDADISENAAASLALKIDKAQIPKITSTAGQQQRSITSGTLAANIAAAPLGLNAVYISSSIADSPFKGGGVHYGLIHKVQNVAGTTSPQGTGYAIIFAPDPQGYGTRTATLSWGGSSLRTVTLERWKVMGSAITAVDTRPVNGTGSNGDIFVKLGV